MTSREKTARGRHGQEPPSKPLKSAPDWRLRSRQDLSGMARTSGALFATVPPSVPVALGLVDSGTSALDRSARQGRSVQANPLLLAGLAAGFPLPLGGGSGFRLGSQLGARCQLPFPLPRRRDDPARHAQRRVVGIHRKISVPSAASAEHRPNAHRIVIIDHLPAMQGNSSNAAADPLRLTRSVTRSRRHLFTRILRAL